MNVIDKWKKAVIHLEGAADSEDFKAYAERSSAAIEDFDAGRITEKEFREKNEWKSKDLRYQGTAILLENNGNYYLLTARHVLWDEANAKRTLESDIEWSSPQVEWIRKINNTSAEEKYFDQIFSNIFRVRSLDEILRSEPSSSLPSHLMNLGAGPSYYRPYTFSNPQLDLAIISLNTRSGCKEFAKSLLNAGYLPISLSDIEQSPTAEGVDVFTVGYPGATSLLGQLTNNTFSKWSSSYVSIPVASFGKVSMLHEELEFFWVDMSAYPGNSGGPVIENGKLVGIVSEQAIVNIEDSDLSARIPFGKIIKAQYLFDLLAEQEKKDQSPTGFVST